MDKLKLNTEVKFNFISITGEEIMRTGEIIGKAKEIKKMWPEEFGGLSENEEIYLIRIEGNSQSSHHVATPSEIVEVLRKGQSI
jgi:hypothetical protein